MTTTLTLAERAVPRYTSYPTAPHFSAAVGAQTYAEWLAALSDTARLSLYLHVPFCTELCLYCGCTTKAVRRRPPVVAYADHLGREIELLGAAIGGRPVVHLHWGGGTPSILGAEILVDLVDQLGRTFDLSRRDRACDRARSAPRDLAARRGARPNRHHAREFRRPGLFAPCAAGDRPRAAVRAGRGGGRRLCVRSASPMSISI